MYNLSLFLIAKLTANLLPHGNNFIYGKIYQYKIWSVFLKKAIGNLLKYLYDNFLLFIFF
jgi:hypothetical protein